MTSSTFRDVQRELSSGNQPKARPLVRIATLVVVVAFAGLAGCDKLPTASELINGKKKETPPAQPTKVASTPVETQPAAAPPKAPEPPKKTPQEVITQFNATPPQLRTDAQLGELAKMPEAVDQFAELNLNGSGVSDTGMTVLPKFERVEKLSIDGCQYTNEALANVAKMKNLASLSMAGGAMKEQRSDKGLAYIKDMHQLTSLSVERARFSMEGFTSIGEMVWLESLNVSGTPFADDQLKALSALTNLKDLNISRTAVTDAGFAYLRPFRDLEVLNIGGLSATYATFHGLGLKELVRRGGLPKLRSLGMYNNPNLNVAAYEGLLMLKRSLESLDAGDAGIDDFRFINAISPLGKLEVLLVHRNPNLTDAGLVALPKLKKLKRLYFSENTGITDRSLPQMAKLKSLESLSIDRTSCTEGGVRQLKKKLKNCDISFNGTKIELE
jgi:Leucine-rich repeat (LRR) protein